MSDGQLWMTDLSNCDRLASDERFDRCFSGDRKEPVERDVRTDHDHATETPRNCGLTSAYGDVIDSRSILSDGFDWGAKTMVLRPVNVHKLNVCKSKGIMFSGGPTAKCPFRRCSHVSRSGNSA
jgi:hypothetical protein